MRRLINTTIVLISLMVFFPGASYADSKDWDISGECGEIEDAGWIIEWDDSKDRMTFGFWIEGLCTVPEPGK